MDFFLEMKNMQCNVKYWLFSPTTHEPPLNEIDFLFLHLPTFIDISFIKKYTDHVIERIVNIFTSHEVKNRQRGEKNHRRKKKIGWFVRTWYMCINKSLPGKT